MRSALQKVWWAHFVLSKTYKQICKQIHTAAWSITTCCYSYLTAQMQWGIVSKYLYLYYLYWTSFKYLKTFSPQQILYFWLFVTLKWHTSLKCFWRKAAVSSLSKWKSIIYVYSQVRYKNLCFLFMEGFLPVDLYKDNYPSGMFLHWLVLLSKMETCSCTVTWDHVAGGLIHEDSESASFLQVWITNGSSIFYRVWQQTGW